MTQITLYHNPRCSKSRATLALLQQHNIEPDIVLYLETPPTAKELKAILAKLGKSARELLRTSEEAYKKLGLSNPDLSEPALINAMLEEPKLIERPIGIKGDKAVLGRPPENILQLID